MSVVVVPIPNSYRSLPWRRNEVVVAGSRPPSYPEPKLRWMGAQERRQKDLESGAVEEVASGAVVVCPWGRVPAYRTSEVVVAGRGRVIYVDRI